MAAVIDDILAESTPGSTNGSILYSLATEGDYSTVTPASPISPTEQLIDVTDVAVIGFGCRVPGGNNSPSQLWDFLLKKGDASGIIPEVRWEPYLTRQPGNADILSTTTSKGYFLDKLGDFDASFFGISPREAEQIDPQQRIAVEVAWEALENAGIPPQGLAGSGTAVYMGVNSDDYSRLLLEDLPNVEAWMGVGTAFCGVPNRISYLLDLMGPSVAIDAACASSLVAIHQGRQALIAHETSLVLAGGVNALIGPGLTRVLDEAGAISADGRCRSFDDAAAGYGRGEGAGVVVLKRLVDAMEDRDNILAVLKGSAVGADGRTNGIMAPNQQAQERVARQALKEAKVSADTISYVEAHATSTALGDPTECAAMANVYGSGARSPGSEPCFIGSIKPNIGHLEAGAGVLGFIKAVMAIKSGLLPPQANLTTLNSHIDWKKSLLEVVRDPTTWPANGKPRRAAIASYGYGGTVSHAIIEAAPTRATLSQQILPRSYTTTASPTILLISAINLARIRASAVNLATWLEDCWKQKGEAELDSVAYTLAVKRGHHKVRTAIIADNRTEAISLLKAVAQGDQNRQIVSGRTLPKDGNKGPIWVFSGHGAQWSGMGQTLINTEPAFVDLLTQIEPIVQREMGFSATAALRFGDFDSTVKIQVLTYIMQVGLAAVLNAAGTKPSACIGHSLGELAASVVAGALTVSEGTLICCKRACFYRTIAGTGAMVLVHLPSREVAREIEGHRGISIAIHSSQGSCVVSGTINAIQEFSTRLQLKGIKTRNVKSDVAFHSPLLLPFVAPMRTSLENILRPRVPEIPLYSTSLSDPRGKDLRDIDYWVNNMIKPVLLTSSINAAIEDGYKIFLEVSSHPIVSHSINEILIHNDCSDSVVVPTMFRDKDSRKSILLALGKLHCLGDPIDFKRFLRGNWLSDVPGTLWNHQPYWRMVSNSTIRQRVTHSVNAHVLLGSRTQISGSSSVLWQTYLDPQVKPFPGHHPLHGSEVVPAAVLLNTFLSAMPHCSLRNVSLHVPVVVGPPREVQVLLENHHMRISSRLTTTQTNDPGDHSWLTNTSTQILEARNLRDSEKVDIGQIRQRLTTRLPDSFSIDYLAKVGVPEMGFPWKVLEHIETEGEMLAKVHADPEADPSIHWGGDSWASILDAATSVSSTIFHKEPLLRMPTAIESVTVLQGLTPKIAYIYVLKATGDYAADVLILDEQGAILVEIQNLRFTGVEGNSATVKSHSGLLYQVAWPPAQFSETPLRFSKVIFISEESALLEGYRHGLSSMNMRHVTVVDAKKILDTDEGSIVVLIAGHTDHAGDMFSTNVKECDRLLSTVKTLIKSSIRRKLFCLTQNVLSSNDVASLSQSSLIGLARIIQSEEPEVFGGLIDVEDGIFPMQAIKYVQGVDVIKIADSVPRNARLRPFAEDRVRSEKGLLSFRVYPHGTYLISGGLGALGLEIASWLVEKGAKRLVLVSRRGLPPRRLWTIQKDDLVIQRILSLEMMGASVHILAIDLTAPDASPRLQKTLDALSLPPILGIIHAAGTLANQTVRETTPEAFNSVIAPKIKGAVVLHELFPPKSLDFMVLFSSCGQLIGFTGQASYASGNAFLDSLATHRRNLGDNTISTMWTSWRGLGMAASTKYIDAELHARGITDITKEEAFHAWEQIFRRDTDHAAILRTLPFDDDDNAPPHPILNDIFARRPRSTAKSLVIAPAQAEPTDGPELEVFLTQKVTKCVATVLSLAENSIDHHVALTELGMDSVMTVGLRSELQKTVGVKVGPTLVWNHPTVSHLVKHFLKEKSK
ncbi:hypothetical protein MMC14_009091 [Varicellaria rhodocarpa]|nr:hypothetical protein [Varicellaria rhodocarpa]